MAHALADSRPRFNSYPTAINTQYAPPPPKQYYHYVPTTPATTPTKSHPSSSYPYRQASNPSHSRLASTPASLSRVPPVCTASIPIARPSTSLEPVSAPRPTNPLPVAPKAYHSRKGSVSRPSQSRPLSADAYRAAKREDERYTSTPASSRPGSLLAEHEATLKHMEARQCKAHAQTWFEEGQRLTQEAAHKQEDENCYRAEKLRADENLRQGPPL